MVEAESPESGPSGGIFELTQDDASWIQIHTFECIHSDLVVIQKHLRSLRILNS